MITVGNIKAEVLLKIEGTEGTVSVGHVEIPLNATTDEERPAWHCPTHCPECGSLNGEGANYCQRCGSFLGDQTQVQPGLDLGFAEGLRALMRQDPDIIMVGEIREQRSVDGLVAAARAWFATASPQPWVLVLVMAAFAFAGPSPGSAAAA